MSRKPDRITAMQQIIGAVKQEFPLYQPDTFRCGPDNSCIGGPKKLMELVDTDLSYWQYQIDSGIPLLRRAQPLWQDVQEHPPGADAQWPDPRLMLCICI